MNNRIVEIVICAMFILLFSTGCVVHEGRRPIDFPNTRWVSQEPDMFFEVHNRGSVSYAQIIVNEEIIELMVDFAESGSSVLVRDLSGFDPDTGRMFPGLSTADVTIFIGLCRFSPDRVVITITQNPIGFLDDSIEKIIFYREDIE